MSCHLLGIPRRDSRSGSGPDLSWDAFSALRSHTRRLVLSGIPLYPLDSVNTTRSGHWDCFCFLLLSRGCSTSTDTLQGLSSLTGLGNWASGRPWLSWPIEEDTKDQNGSPPEHAAIGAVLYSCSIVRIILKMSVWMLPLCSLRIRLSTIVINRVQQDTGCNSEPISRYHPINTTDRHASALCSQKLTF